MPSTLARRVGRAIRARGLWEADDRVAVAVSAGADSVALLWLLAELADRAGWRLAGIIHVHHGLRGAPADADAAFCRELAARLDMPIQIVFVDVARAMADSRRSLESTARRLRYEAFDTAASALGATVVATGHTCDDQAETVLLRLLRGATARGVSGIRPRRGPYVRPLLDFRRAELCAYLSDRRESHREDESNADRSIPRNRLRHELMPVVETAWPGGVSALARFADTSASDERMLSGLALEARSKVIHIAADGVELNRPGLAALDEAVARRVVRDALELAGGSPVFREVQAVWRLAHSARVRSSVDLHRLRAQRDGDQIRLRRPSAFTTVSGFTYLLNLPGEVQIVETGASVRASLLSGPDIPALSDGWEAMAALQASTVATPLTVRTRLAGDRLLPLGAPGSRTLQNLLVDRKISRDARATLPVVVDADGQIVWVAGVAQSDHCRVRTPLSGMVILEFKKGTL